MLKDGADSVGALGALNRVYLNIGLFSEEWLLHFNPLIGGKRITPIEIAVARKNSSYWQATEAQTPDLAPFFLATTEPHQLKDAPGGDAYLTHDTAQLDRGKKVFAEHCARCHSSKLPTPRAGRRSRRLRRAATISSAGTGTGSGRRPTTSRARCGRSSCADDFLDDNYLSTDLRVPVTLLQTNACSPLATNAIARQHLGQLLLRSPTRTCPSVGHDHRPRSVHRRAAATTRCRPAAAATRVRRR